MIHLTFISTIVELDDADAELKGFVGETGRRSPGLKRPAVHEQKDAQVDAMKESFLATTSPYMERPKFVGRFGAKSFMTEEEEKNGRDLAAISPS